MTDVMTPSEITSGQIGKFQELLGARLRKSGLQSEPVQQILASQGDVVADEMVAAIRKRVEAMSSMIVRRVRVDRSRTPRQTIDATGRVQYVDRKVVDAMPRGEGEEAEVCFFKLDRFVRDDELEHEYELRGLKSDPIAQAVVNTDDPAFADERPNGCHWKDANGNWCYAAFDRWDGERLVNVHRSVNGWDDDWWFGGVRVRK